MFSHSMSGTISIDRFVQMVQDLETMLLERLLQYQKHNNNRLPDRILVFRDGVSEVSPRIRGLHGTRLNFCRVNSVS